MLKPYSKRMRTKKTMDTTNPVTLTYQPFMAWIMRTKKQFFYYDFIVSLYPMLAALLLLALAIPASAEAVKPNVVLIMVDDLAYADLSCYGSKLQRTPVLDRLAAEGVRLTSFYSGATVCTPSRMALLTGAYAKRLGWQGGVVGFGVKPHNGLAPEALTIAEAFKSAGYRTGMCGKWHLGDTPELSPNSQGFDTAYYIKKSNNQCRKIWQDGELVTERFDNRRLTENFTREAIKFIKANREKPFFLYLPFTAPHFPAQAHPDWKGKSANDEFGDVVEELDNRLGDIFEALSSAGLDEKTLVVFLSDNGTDPCQKKWSRRDPFRGMKWSSLEGGTRVPCIVRWPGVVPAGRTCDALTSAIDLTPTLTHACGIDLSKLPNGIPKLDGVNVWDTLLGKDGEHPRKHLLYWTGWAKPEAIRVGEWKLFFTEVKDIEDSDKGPVLIHLNEQPGELGNLCEKHPEKVQEMKTLADQLLADIEANGIPMGGPPVSEQ